MKFGTLVIPVVVAILISVLSFFFAMFYASYKQDERSLKTEINTLQHEVEMLYGTMETLANDNAWWDVSVDKLYLNEDIEWADKTLGESTNSFQYMDGTLILRSDGSILFGTDGNGIFDVADIAKQLAMVAKTLSHKGESGEQPERAGLLRSGNQVIAYGLGMVRPASENYPHDLPPRLPIIIFYSNLTQDRLNAVSLYTGIQDLKLNKVDRPLPDGMARIPLNDIYGNPIASISWKPVRPGSELLSTLKYPSLLSFILVTVSFGYFIIQAIRTMKNMDIANKSKSAFLASMSHEIRTPLNSIIGFSQLLDMELFGKIEGAKNKEYLKVIKSSGEHLLSIINDILDLSKLEAGKFDTRVEKLNPAKHITSCVSLMEAIAEKKGVKLEAIASDASIYTDGRMLRQVILNIISNAVKFTDTGGSVLVRGTKDGNDYIITVKDSGIGMTKKQIEIAMMPFGQVESEYAREHSGTGLGIPLVKRFMELLDGTFDIKSTAGKGTTAILTFPTKARPKDWPVKK